MPEVSKGADFSIWDGGVPPYHLLAWDQYTWDFAFIKCSEGLYVDPLFKEQWAAARGRAIRGAYHFFHPIVDPKTSAAKTIDILGGDLGELPIALDLEVTDGYPDTLDRAKSWLAWYEQWTGIRPIIYSSPNFLDNVVGAWQHPWLSGYKLWLAQYPFDNMSPDTVRDQVIHDVLYQVRPLAFPIPPVPFQTVNFLQWTSRGKPEDVPGYYLGSGHKLAVDLIFYPGSRDELLMEFDIDTTPTPNGGTMPDYIYEITPAFSDGSKIRPDHNVFNTSISSLPYGRTARGNEDWIAPADGLNVMKGDRWLHVLESDGKAVDGWIAEIHMGKRYATIKNISTTPTPEPVPAPVELEAKFTFELTGYDPATVTTVLKPKL
jgi:hypothetical protein